MALLNRGLSSLGTVQLQSFHLAERGEADTIDKRVFFFLLCRKLTSTIELNLPNKIHKLSGNSFYNRNITIEFHFFNNVSKTKLFCFDTFEELIYIFCNYFSIF